MEGRRLGIGNQRVRRVSQGTVSVTSRVCMLLYPSLIPGLLIEIVSAILPVTSFAKDKGAMRVLVLRFSRMKSGR